MKAIEELMENLLWGSRLIVVLPVVFGLLLAIGVFVVTTVDSTELLHHMLQYLDPTLNAAERSEQRLETISQAVAIIDGYLLASIMLIFSLGLYELFVSKINKAEGSEIASRLLLIRSLDDLKDRLANVILLILIVKFFQQALNMKYQEPLDLLYLALGVIFLAGALFLSSRKAAKNGKSPAENGA